MLIGNSVQQILYVVGAFLCYMIADGCTFSVGILYTEFLNFFNQSKAVTAILPGLMYAIPQFFGIIACPLIHTIGSGYGAIIGGFILSISLFVSQFVASLNLMYVTLGVCASLGLEMTYVSGIMAVTKGFGKGKYLGLALGISVSGSGIGVLIFNPLLSYLINEFGWKGAMTIESAIFLNIVVAGSLFKLASVIHLEPTQPMIDNRIETPSKHIEVVINQENINSIVKDESHSTEGLDIIKESYDDQGNDATFPRPQPSLVGRQSPAVIMSKAQIHNCEPFYKPINYQNKTSSLERRKNCGENFSVQLPVDEHAASFLRRLSSYGSQTSKSSSIKSSHNVSHETISSEPCATINISEHTSHHNVHLQSNYDIHLLGDDNDFSPSKLKIFFADLRQSILSLFSIKVWTNKSLLIFNGTSVLFAMSVIVVWTFSYNHSIELKISDTSAALLLSLVGVGSCLGQIFFGFISEFFPSILLYALGCIMAGVVTIVLGFITTYWGIASLHLLFGFGQGVNYALFSVILVHYGSVELYPACLAIYLLCNGTGNLIGTSLGGYISDVTGDYKIAYISGGSLLVSCGIMVLPLAYLWYKEDRERLNDET